ncbi:hypothetical protein [Streptosporangium sp. NPDC002721]|uniref:hypothetical protein n=1 Tax=Streptosporangium sp. NPDC002721 TaxID=3366188 RepID=UPI0036744DCD
MNLVTNWTTLKESDSADLVLCVDFTGTGRAEAGFSTLVARMDLDATFWHVDPPGLAPGSGVDGPGYLGSWLPPIMAGGRNVTAVLGYCVGAVYAGELATRLAEVQERAPALVVFDPEPITLENIYFQFGKVFDILSSILTPEDVVATQEAMDRLIGQEGVTVGRYADHLYGTFSQIAHNAFERAGLDMEYAEEMLGTFSAFLSYMSLADQFDPWGNWRKAVAVSSSTPHNGLNRLRDTAPGPLVAEELRFEETHAELFRSDEIARAVTKVLER